MEYTNTKRQIIGIRNNRVFWVVGLLLGTIPLYLFLEIVFGKTVFAGPTAVMIGSLARVLLYIGLYIFVYQLSMSVEPHRPTAAIVTFSQIIPLVGLFVLVSLCRKAWKISHAIVEDPTAASGTAI